MSVVLWVIVGAALLLGALHVWTRTIALEAEAAIPQAGQIHDVPGGAVHYVDLGPKDAPVLVLIHGLAGQLQHYTYALTERLETDFRLIVVDRPGCGYSTRAGAETAVLSEQARMLWTFLTEIGITQPVLVGHSLGGALSLQMALDRPEATGGIVLLAPATVPVSEVPEVFKGLVVSSPGLRWFLSNVITAPLGKFTVDTVLAGVFAPDKRPDDFPLKGGALLGLRPKGFVTASEDFNMMPAALAALKARYGDTLPVAGGVLYGSEDALLPEAEHGAPMGELGLRYETLPGRGHMLPMIAPDETADFIRSVIAELPVGQDAGTGVRSQS